MISEIERAKIEQYRVEYTTSNPDNEVWIPPGPPQNQEFRENLSNPSNTNLWITPGQAQEFDDSSTTISRQFSQYADPYEFVPPISKFEPPPSYTENDENRHY